MHALMTASSTGEKYENLDECPVCTALRYKIRRDDPGDVDGEPPVRGFGPMFWFVMLVNVVKVVSYLILHLLVFLLPISN